MDVQVLARAHYRRQARLALVASRASAREWRRLSGTDLAGSWDAGVGLRILALVTAAQHAAADGSTEYVAAAVTAQGGHPDAQGLAVDAASFAGAAADGRPLESLILQPVLRARQALAEGTRAAEAMRTGLTDLLRIVSTEVADAGRGAVGAAIVADRRVTGYVRVLNSPSCARCVLLAGKEYGWNKGFQRHPHCDCVHLPTIRGVQAHHIDPGDYFRSLSATEQNQVFTVAGARAIRDGADIWQVVNARRGISTVGSWVRDGITHRGRAAEEARLGSRRLTTTTEGMTRRGLAAKRLKRLEAEGRAPARARLTPEAIYELASDRDEAVRLLYRYGYLY